MPTSVPAGGFLDQKRWAPYLTLFTESQTIVGHLMSREDGAIIHTDDRQDAKADLRGSQVEFKYADRFRGQQLAPRALGATKFGSETGQRPIYKQTLNLMPQELSTAGFFALWAGQQYTDVPIEQHDLRAAGAEAAEIITRSLYYHLAGIVRYNRTDVWPVPPCGNLVRELDAAHRFYTNGQTSDTGVAGNAANTLTMEFLETVATKLMSHAHVNSPCAIPSTPWGDFAIFICDKEGLQQLTTHSTTNRVMSLSLAEIQGGKSLDQVASWMKANQGFQGTKQILVLVDDYTPFGQDTNPVADSTASANVTQIGNVRRGMLLFRRAMELEWGQGFNADTSHIMASNFKEHEWDSWKLMTHWGGLSCRPDAAIGSGQRFGSATVSYYVSAATPIY